MSTLSLLPAFLDYFNENVENVIATIYIVIAYHQLFGYSWWGTLWRCAVVFITTFLMLSPFIFLSAMFGKPEMTAGKDIHKGLLIGGGVLAGMYLLTSLVLFIIYRLSSKR